MYMMEFVNYITISAFLIWFILWIITTIVFSHKKVPLEKAIALILFIVWIGLHIWGFYLNQPVSWIFDIMWAAACWGLIGIDTISLLRKLRNKDEN